MKKKICIINKFREPNHRSFYKDGLSLVKAGYDVCILGFYNTKTVNGIRLIGFDPPKRRIVRFLITNYRIFIRSLKEKADVYHFHDLDFLLWGVLLKLTTNAKVIYCIREAHPEYMLLKTYLPKFLRRTLFVAIYLVEHVAVKFFDAIVPCDNNISKGFVHKNNIVIFHFPTLEFFENDRKTPWEKREYDLFYHGSVPKYHFEVMMKVAEKLNQENIKNKWGIVTKEGSPLDWINHEIKKRQLDENFKILPFADYLNVYEYLSNAKIGIIPLPPYSKFMKNIPVKMFEFMGFGMPVVLSDLPPSRQFIKGENCAISVEPDNIDEYANAIKLLLNDPETAIKMGKNGQKLVFNKYNWAIEEKKLLNLHNLIIDKG